MLIPRGKYSSQSIWKLTESQINFKREYEKLVKNGSIKLIEFNCILCNSNKFLQATERDRYGYYMPVKICKMCGLVQTNPRMNKQDTVNFFKNKYRKLVQPLPIPNDDFFKEEYERGRLIYDFISQALNCEIKKKFIVEIGTGAGGILHYFKEKGNDVFGIDLDEKYIEFGKNRGLDLEVGTVKNLESLKRKPDIVIYCQSLAHISDPIEELKLLKKFLHSDSILFIESIGIKNLKYFYNQDFIEYTYFSKIFHFTLTTLTNCARKAGFDLINGNEIIKAIFKLGNPSNNYKNDFEDVTFYLTQLEKLRNNKLFVIQRKFLKLIFFLIKKAGLKPFIETKFSILTSKSKL